MKFLNKIGAWSVLALAMVACVDQDPEIQDFPSADVDFTYEVNVKSEEDAKYKIDYYVVSEIKFNNTSAKTGAVKWNFGTTEYELREGDVTSSNPIVKYKTAGRYNVTLTIEGVGSRTYPILIYDIQPKLTIKKDETAESDLIEVNLTSVAFDLELPNPEKKNVEYKLTFPSGTINTATSQPITELNLNWTAEGGLSQALPIVKFSDIGSRQIQVEAKYDVTVGGENRDLEPSFLNVKVACDEPAPTLYYAAKDGNIKALKLVDTDKVSYGVYPYDLGVISGDNPFNMCYAKYTVEDKKAGTSEVRENLYVLDAGKKHYYSGTPETEGDGKITAMGLDGSNVNVVIANTGLHGFNDPYYGAVVGNYLYYTDRNIGVRKIALTERNQMETAIDAGGKTKEEIEKYFVKQQWLDYYGAGITYGAIFSSIYCDAEKVWWLGMHFNGQGIYRFKETDIHRDAQINTANLPYNIVLGSSLIKSFTIDEEVKRLYIWRRDTQKGGFQAYELPANSAYNAANLLSIDTKVTEQMLKASHLMAADPINTTADEGVYTTQFAVDPNSHRVYFAYRSTDSNPSGIYYYDPASTATTNCCKLYGNTEGEAGLGICINPNKTKLFLPDAE